MRQFVIVGKPHPDERRAPRGVPRPRPPRSATRL